MTQETAITVLIADDHAILREGLAGLLAEQDDIEVVGAAVNGADAVSKVRELKPSILLLDLMMPEMDGVSALEALSGEAPDTRTIILTGADDDQLLARSIQAGAVGYLLKDVASSQLIDAIRAVAAGGCWLPADVTDKLVRAIAGKQKTSEVDKLALLTRRELEILQLLGELTSNLAIGDKLFISENTVKVHVSHILEKLGLTSRHEAIKFAIRSGIAKA